jgi:hypothetical protein
MPDISRRHFLRNASLGAAAVGAAAVVGPTVFNAATASGEVKHPAHGATVVQPAGTAKGPMMVAEIVDAAAGTIAIYVGTRKVTYVNRDIAQQLLKAAQ